MTFLFYSLSFVVVTMQISVVFSELSPKTTVVQRKKCRKLVNFTYSEMGQEIKHLIVAKTFIGLGQNMNPDF